MGSMLVIVGTEIHELPFPIAGIPEKRLIQTCTTHSADQLLDKGLQSRKLGYTFDFLDIQNL